MTSYVITRDDELLHFGIKGQKWGVRRYENEDGTLTEAGKKRYSVSGRSERDQDKAYYRESKKLSKLASRTDVSKQKELAAKYDKRARNAAKVGGVATGLMAVTAPAAQAGYKHLMNKGIALQDASNEAFDNARYWVEGWKDNQKALKGGGVAIASDETRNHLSNEWSVKGIANDLASAGAFGNAVKLKKAASIGYAIMGGVAAGAYAVAGYSKIRSAIAKSRTTPIGHLKAQKKYEKQVNRMIDMFANTKYSDIVNKT